MLRLNCGSGQRPFDKPWINIDTQERWNPDLVSDMSALPYDDNSAELIVGHHVLEHFEIGKADDLIREWHRVLAPGGSLLIFVPDLRALVEAWREGRIDDYIFCVNLYGAYMGDIADRHAWAYTFETLAAKLRKAAHWREVKRFDWRKVAGADLAQDWWVLAVEAVK